MSRKFDINKFKHPEKRTDQYQRQLHRLRQGNMETEKIEHAVQKAATNLREENPSPFIIYGEPQSGKTEMMICLAAKLLDEGYPFIAMLLNDSVDLLSQNLGRFQISGLAPSPKNFSEILDPNYQVDGISHVVFCKKNARDLEKLTDKIGSLGQMVVIDDEADYATPNAKINRPDQTRTKINELIAKLLGSNGRYIGVTATPARLDLNNTFNNDPTKWVEFGTHSAYTGQNDFFPVDKNLGYRINLLPSNGDDSKYPREALFSFLVATAYLNIDRPDHEMNNYSMLVHTSGKIDDHQRDTVVMRSVFESLIDNSSKKFNRYIEGIWQVAQTRYPDNNPDEITRFILENISRHKIIVLNSRKDVSISGADATNPKSLFTIVVGGNIVSRGVTLNNLLSMYFTRDVKHKIQQDTYIQRARMFGVRNDYLEHFELSIPSHLYNDWHRCFVYHKLSLDGARNGNPPIWATDKRVSAVAGTSIDKANVYHTNRSEMSFDSFCLDKDAHKLLSELTNKKFLSPNDLATLHDSIGEKAIPRHLGEFVKHFGSGGNKIVFYPPDDVSEFKPDPARGDDIENVYRSRGFWGQFNRDKESSAVHHFKIFHYKNLRGRLFYKYDCDDIDRLTFLWKTRNG